MLRTTVGKHYNGAYPYYLIFDQSLCKTQALSKLSFSTQSCYDFDADATLRSILDVDGMCRSAGA